IAGVFDFDDPFIDVPPGALGQAAMRCLVPSDITIATASSQDHAHAQSVAAYLDPPGGPPATTPFYTGLNAANPLPLQASVPVPAGAHLRFACAYQNVTGTSELLRGDDYQAEETCALSGTYYPRMDAAAETCALAPDGFGVGSATCGQTLACVNACAPGSAPPADLGLGQGGGGVDPCWQRCVVQSCADASAPLFTLLGCSRANCAAECADPASPACVTCQSDHCPGDSSACAANACGG
ncbi:MAG: hypothetical protein JOZ69_15555, partial [Myxococcales bacterium]|nr:hypothetical protein [Myxococcales bacterium]